MVGAASLTAADVAGKALGFLIMPYLANRMGSVEFGVLNLYISVTQILIFIIALGGPALITAEYIRNGYTSARRLRAASLTVTMWTSALLVVISLVLSWFIPAVIPIASGILIVAVSCVQAINTIEMAYYRGSQTYTLAIVGQFAFALLSLALTILAFEFDSPTATNRLLCILVAGGSIQALYALDLRRKAYAIADRQKKRVGAVTIIKFGLSISPHVVGGWIRTTVDRFVLIAYLGAATTGIYSVALSLAAAEALLFTAVSQQLQPFLYRRLKSLNISGFQRVQIAFAAIVVAFTVCYYFVLTASFGILFDSEYKDAQALLPALLGGAAAQSIYTNFSHAAFYERRASAISKLTTISLVFHLTMLGGLAFRNQISPSSVSLTFFASSSVAMLSMTWLSHRIIRRMPITTR